MTSSNSSSRGGEQTRNPYPPHHRLPRWAWWLVIALAFAAIFGAGTQVLFRQWRANMKIEVPVHKEKGQQFEGWRTYRNEKFGFEVKYPNTWFASIDSSTGPWRFQSNSFSENLKGLGIPKEGMWISINHSKCSARAGGNFEEIFYNENIEYASGGIQKNYVPTLEKIGCMGDFQTTLGLWSNDPDKAVNKLLLNQIFSTFKFISTSTENILPPDPGEAGKATLEGIDSDRDGVRDDVQRFIITKYPESEKTRAALAQFARSYQIYLTDSTGQESTAIKNADANGKALDCLSYIVGPEKASVLLEQIQPVLINTELRLKTLWKIENLLSGTVFPLSSISERKTACAFNPDLLPN